MHKSLFMCVKICVIINVFTTPIYHIELPLWMSTINIIKNLIQDFDHFTDSATLEVLPRYHSSVIILSSSSMAGKEATHSHNTYILLCGWWTYGQGSRGRVSQRKEVVGWATLSRSSVSSTQGRLLKVVW